MDILEKALEIRRILGRFQEAGNGCQDLVGIPTLHLATYQNDTFIGDTDSVLYDEDCPGQAAALIGNYRCPVFKREMYYVIFPKIIHQMKVNIPHRPLCYAYMETIIKELATLDDNLRSVPMPFVRLLQFLDG